LILYVCAIRKKISNQKEKTFLFGDFFTYRKEKRRRRGGKIKRGKTKKEQYTHRVNSNLPVEALQERKRISFSKQGKNPYLQKAILFLKIKKK